jgi:hypothetical protein
MPAQDSEMSTNSVGSTLDTPMAAAGLVIGALVALILLKRGFRGVNVGGVSVGIK